MEELRRPQTTETKNKSIERGEEERERPEEADSYDSFIGVRIPSSLDKYLSKLAKKYKTGKPELIRTLIEDALIMEAEKPIKTFYTLRKDRIEDVNEDFKNFDFFPAPFNSFFD